MIFATVSTLNYLYKAEILAKSIKEQHPKARVIVCLIEKEIHPDVKKVPYFDGIILAKDLGIDDFNRYIFKYDAAEAAWALKSQILKYLLKNEKDHSEFVYLDSDIRLYSPFVEIESILKNNPIVLTPHDTENGPNRVYLLNGIFNAGFVGITRSKEAKKFIRWWAKKVTHYCYRDRNLSLYDDQGWLKLVPTYFKTYIIRHPGYNIAFWNFHERNLKLSINNEYTVNDIYPLRFFHHSQHLTYLKDSVEKANNEILQHIYFQYTEELKQATLLPLSNEPWSYEFFNDGSQIEKISRRNFLKSPHLQKQPNPFTLSNKILTIKQ
ncbi:hypothetical protein [Cytobacillus firmus]|uniref:hypothetical protein n=1 Tax=Cytobacillus firmus TaxID=1399 RepID=UPI0022283AB5|nr:hypothetical protein [Cytobacillus firmus]